MRRAVFLDRDGVINRAYVVNGVPVPPKNLDDLEILAGVKDAIKLLRDRDFVIVVVTNQPDVARGTVTQESVEAINSSLGIELGIEYFYTCFHDDAHGCHCRKPAPGLIRQAAFSLDLDLSNSFLVGDRWRDISAAQAVNCQSFFIDYSYDERPPKMPYIPVSSLVEAAYLIIGGIK